jgi:GT2 family glycosyltransferase
VDNGSKGNDADIIEDKYRDFIKVIRNDRNYGFAEGNNTAIRWLQENSRADYYLLLNNDTVAAPDFLTALVETAESDSAIGIVGPKILYLDPRGGKNIIWSAGGRIRRWSPHIYQHIGLKEEDRSQFQTISEVDWVTGAAMMLKRGVVDKLSLLDSGYFFGKEDIEYCLRARRCGYKVAYAPESVIWHKVGASRKRMGYRSVLLSFSHHFRLIRRNFSAAVFLYQMLMLPVIVCQRAAACLSGYRADRDSTGAP